MEENLKKENENENENESETIKVIKEEYENKLAKQKSEYETKIETLNKNHVSEIRALMSGKISEDNKKNIAPELSFAEKTLNDTRKKFGLKGEK